MQKRPFFTPKRPFLCCKMTQFDDQITANASADKVAYHVPQFLFLGSLAKDLLYSWNRLIISVLSLYGDDETIVLESRRMLIIICPISHPGILNQGCTIMEHP